MAAYGESPVIREVLQEASDALGLDMARLIAEGPADELARTVNTQPVMVTAGVAAYRLWRSLGGDEHGLHDPDPRWDRSREWVVCAARFSCRGV